MMTGRVTIEPMRFMHLPPTEVANMGLVGALQTMPSSYSLASLDHQTQFQDDAFPSLGLSLYQPFRFRDLLDVATSLETQDLQGGKGFVTNMIERDLTIRALVETPITIGIGADCGLRGELIIDGGNAVIVGPDGIAQILDLHGLDSQRTTPFAVVIPDYRPHLRWEDRDISGFRGFHLENIIQFLKVNFLQMGRLDHYAAFRIGGRFTQMQLRTVRQPTMPRCPFDDIVLPLSAASFAGVVVGFYIPAHISRADNYPPGGFHFHTIADTRFGDQCSDTSKVGGGHVFDFMVERLEFIEAAYVGRVYQGWPVER